MRLAHTQVCPALQDFDAITPLVFARNVLDRHLDISNVECDE